MNQKPKLVSLFSGCGGLDVGFEKAGFQRVWANDFDPDAQAVFRLNLGEIDEKRYNNCAKRNPARFHRATPLRGK